MDRITHDEVSAVAASASPHQAFGRAPPVPKDVVERLALRARVDGAAHARIVLICAPAGFGKTTALQQLSEQASAQGQRVCWLRFDASDRPAGERWLARFAAACREHEAVFVDDFDGVDASQLLAGMTRLLDPPDAGTRVHIACRQEPPLPWSRWRARAQLLEVGPVDLRFSAAETEAFLRHQPLRLDPPCLRRLHDKTQGWPAALRLAVIAMERHPAPDRFIAGFGGDSELIATYIAEEVLEGQARAVRDFMVRTCVLERLDASACAALGGEADAGWMLSRLANAQLIQRLPGPREGYRYHPLLADVLRRALHRSDPAGERLAHRRAAHWWMAQDQPLAAIGHLIAGDDLPQALSVLAGQAESLLKRGRAGLLCRWLDAMPQALLCTRPELQLAHAWAVMLTRGAQESLAVLSAIDLDGMADARVATHARALQAMLLGLMDRIDEAHADALGHIEQMPLRSAFAHRMLTQTLSSTSMVRGEVQAALRHADALRGGADRGEQPFPSALADSVQGAIQLMRGRLKEATAHLRRAVSEGTQDELPERFAMPSVLLAEALYDAGEVERCLPILLDHLPLLRVIGLPDQLISAHTLVARIRWSRGDADAAIQTLDELESVGRRFGLERAVASARLERARGYLARGRLAVAQEELRLAEALPCWPLLETRWHIANDLLTPALVRAQCLLQAGSAQAVLDLLGPRLLLARQAGRQRRALGMEILMAAGRYLAGERAAALRALQPAWSFAQEEGFVSAFRGQGAVVDEMVQALGEGASARPGPSAARALAAAAGSGLEPLTPQESKVLALLAQGLSNELIAQRLFVSRSTVRTHLRSISAKLRATSRTHAVAVARELSLLP